MIGKKIENPKKSASKSVRIRRLVGYIMAPETENKSEKCVYRGARGFFATTLQGQTAEMVALALDAPRSHDPIEHYVLSWSNGEMPTPAQIRKAVDFVMAEGKVKGHQMLFALHADTDNWHVHLMLNRVHPETLKVVKINGGFDKIVLHRACARIEHAQGWRREENALYRVDAKGNVIPTSTKRKERGDKPEQSQVDTELRKGEKSAARFAVEIAGPILASAKSWEEVHQRLAAHGMRYLTTGSGKRGGAVIQVGDVRVKASTVSRNATIARLYDRLGAYVPPQASSSSREGGVSPEDEQKGTPPPPTLDPKNAWPFVRDARTWEELHRTLAEHDMRYEKTGSGATVFAGKDDELSMKASAVSRNATLRKLEARFGPYFPPPGLVSEKPSPVTIYKDFPRWQEYVDARARNEEDERTAHEELERGLLKEEERLKTRHQEEREALFAQRSWQGQLAALHLQRSLLAFEHRKEKEELKENVRLRRQALVDAYPRFPEFVVWIQDSELACLWRCRRWRVPSIAPGEGPTHGAVPRLKRDIRDYHGREVDGWVIYSTTEQRARGETAFVDKGDRINIHDSENEASILAALQLASVKWTRLRIKGDRAYRETCARLAAEHGFNIKNPELQETILKYRRTINEQRERMATHDALPSRPKPPERLAPTPKTSGRTKAWRGEYDPW